jgi:hypothetical protein
MQFLFAILGLLVVFLLGACSTIPMPERSESSAAALQLLDVTQRAHGKDSFGVLVHLSDKNSAYSHRSVISRFFRGAHESGRDE